MENNKGSTMTSNPMNNDKNDQQDNNNGIRLAAASAAPAPAPAARRPSRIQRIGASFRTRRRPAARATSSSSSSSSPCSGVDTGKIMMCCCCLLTLGLLGLGIAFLVMGSATGQPGNLVLDACCTQTNAAGACAGGYRVASGTSCPGFFNGTTANINNFQQQVYTIPVANTDWSTTYHPVLFCPAGAGTCSVRVSAKAGGTLLLDSKTISSTSPGASTADELPPDIKTAGTVGALQGLCGVTEAALKGAYGVYKTWSMDDSATYDIDASKAGVTSITLTISDLSITDPDNHMKVQANGRPLIRPLLGLEPGKTGVWVAGLVLTIVFGIIAMMCCGFLLAFIND